MLALKTMKDGASSIIEPLEEIDLSNDLNVKRPIFINSQLIANEKQKLTELLKKCQEMFDWSSEKILGLNFEIVCYSLNIEPGSKPVK